MDNNSSRFTKAMYTLATMMNEDVDLVTKRFKILAMHMPTSWKVTYLNAHLRASRGIQDPWFYNPPK